jgi:hypothetical protein
MDDWALNDLLKKLHATADRQRRILNSTLAQIATIEKAIQNQNQLDMMAEQKSKK